MKRYWTVRFKKSVEYGMGSAYRSHTEEVFETEKEALARYAELTSTREYCDQELWVTQGWKQVLPS